MLKKERTDVRAVELRIAQQGTRLRIVVDLPGKGRVRLDIRKARQKVRNFLINYQSSENQSCGTFLAIVLIQNTLQPLRESR
jgi:hypothetical protein